MMNPSNFAENFRSMFNVGQLTDTCRRNMEATTSVMQSMMEGTQAMMRRQTEIAQNNAQAMMSATRDMMSSGTPESNLSRQTALAKGMLETTLSNVRELTEMGTKCSMEALSKLQDRATESMEEMSNATTAAATGNKRKSA